MDRDWSHTQKPHLSSGVHARVRRRLILLSCRRRVCCGFSGHPLLRGFVMDRFVSRAETAEQRERRILRMVAKPGPDMVLEDLPGFAPPLDWAAEMRQVFSPWTQTGKDLRILLLCAGVDAPSYAFQMMGIPHVAEVWDVDPWLKPALLKLHRSCERLHVGPIAGDILRQPCCSFGSANVLVAGPPCPPWSSMGVQKSWDDPRAAVFDKVLKVINDQAWRSRSSGPRSDAFFMFLLENVEGMLKRSKADKEAGLPCPMEQVRLRLQETLPACWILTVMRAETCEAGLPHKRGRVYLRGLDRQALSPHTRGSFTRWWGAGPRLEMVFAPARLPHPGLGSCVRLDLPNTDKVAAGRGNKYMKNLDLYKISHVEAMTDQTKKGMFAVVDLSRDRDCGYGEVARFDDLCLCLTASNETLWVFSLGVAPASLDRTQMPTVALPVDRWLHPCERALLQGFPPDMRVRVRDATRVFGNAMSVPVVGFILYPVLHHMMPAFL